jgi:23S rRNA (adenine2503-C2)-methyltransferase
MTGGALEQWARSRGASAGGARALARFLLARAAGRPLPEPPARALLAEAPFALDLPPADVVPDPDGTVRFAVRLADGAVVETVLIHQPASALRSRERWTVCVSSQVGCARGCVFCETGRIGSKS